jgi:RHH-type transcriptional regulator, proline utilization regulon repressor / proline dehydrogenase / delta 1-pyrroline-5-carboxylate dehydrogenase
MIVDPARSSSEAKTQAIAQQLLAESTEKRSIFAKVQDKFRWDDKLLSWTMDNPSLRVQLFRLIDCLPSLTTKAEIARHLQEYLSDPTVELPQALKGLLNFTAPDSIPGQVAATTLSTAVETLARKYIAGENLNQTLKSIDRLRNQSMNFTIDLLGEAVVTELEAQSYLDRYLDLMAQLTAARVDSAPVQISVKLTAFYSQFDPLDVEGSQAKVSERVRILLRKAQEVGAAVHFDMEQYRYKNATLGVLKALLMEEEFGDRTDIGITLQAYLRDSYQDLKDLIIWAKQRGKPITVRLIRAC